MRRSPMMTKPYEHWNVLPHGPVVRVDDDILTLVVRTASGTTLVLNDLVGNIRSTPDVGNWLLRLAGFAGPGAQIPKLVKLAMVRDADALRDQLLQWAEYESPRRILVSHGDPIETNAPRTLRELARSL